MNTEQHPVRAMRIGLVLSGGGAKGAYQVGSCQALRDAGIDTYSAIAGTSVGSLTAALVATGRFGAADKLWRTIHWSKVIGIEPKKLLLLPIWAVCVMYRLRHGAPPSRHPDRIWRILPAAHLIWMVGLIVGLFCLGAGRSWMTLMEQLRLVWVNNASTLVWCTVLSVLMLMGGLVPKVVLKWMATNNKPLAAFLEEELPEAAWCTINTPVWVAVSRLRPFTTASMAWSGWVPDYIRLDALAHQEGIGVLLQSAGLPGVFTVRQVLGEEAIDGGWCDNNPVAPLLYGDGTPLDLVFIIYLQAAGASDYESPIDAAKMRWTAYKQSAMGERQARELDRRFMDNETPIYDPIPKDIHLPRIIEVYPSRSLGNFVMGTLNFSAVKAAELIDLGKKDMEEVLLRLRREYEGQLPSADLI